MTDKEKRIIDKLKAIIKNTPYEGERSTALNVLKKYCITHNINLDDVRDEKIFTYNIREKANTDYGLFELFTVIVKKHFERKKQVFKDDAFRYWRDGKRYEIYLEMLTEDFISIVAEYEFYSKYFVDEYNTQLNRFKRKFFRAFLHSQNLLLNPKEEETVNEQPTPEQIRFYVEAEMMADGIKKQKYYKQIK